MTVDATLPDPAVVVLVGPAGSGKSTWAARRYRAQEIASSDALRAVVGSGESDLDASEDAFALLDAIVRARIRRGLTVVIDTLGLDSRRRREWLRVARAVRSPAVAVVFATPAGVCRARNRERGRPVPAKVLDSQLARMRDIAAELSAEGWQTVTVVHAADPPPAETTRPSTDPLAVDRDGDGRLEFVLQVSSFGWQDDPGGWLRSIATTASEAGFGGIALMGHLIQIPQVGRAWDPIPEPWVTLGYLAALDTDLRLGTLVTPVTFYRAGVLAKIAATLDVLSGGRSFVGVGAGWWDREHAAYGLDFPPTADRMRMLEETIETMRALWAAGTKAFTGSYVRLPETTCYPRPVGRPAIIVGGGGEGRTLQIAARLGDGCNLVSDPAIVARKRDVLRSHCQAVGRDPAQVRLTVLDVPIVGRDRDDTAALVEKHRGRSSAAGYAKAHNAGIATAHVQRYRTLSALGVSTIFVALPQLEHADDVARFGAVIEAMT